MNTFLEVTTPHLRGTRIPVGGGATTIGRGDGVGTILGDPSVSRRHAVVEDYGGRLMVRDLNSSNGTWVNGIRIIGAVPVNEGDVVVFGNVETHLVADARPTYHIGDQRAAGHINNVAGNQYNYEVQRESFLAEIAARKSWGRWLVSFGFVLNFVGFGLFAYGIFAFIGKIPSATIDTPPEELTPFGPDVNGVPLGVIGFSIAAIGMFVLIAGIVFHVSAAARRRQLERLRRQL